MRFYKILPEVKGKSLHITTHFDLILDAYHSFAALKALAKSFLKRFKHKTIFKYITIFNSSA